MHSCDPARFVLGKAGVIRQSKGRKMQSPTIHGHMSEPLWRDFCEEKNKLIYSFCNKYFQSTYYVPGPVQMLRCP